MVTANSVNCGWRSCIASVHKCSSLFTKMQPVHLSTWIFYVCVSAAQGSESKPVCRYWMKLLELWCTTPSLWWKKTWKSLKRCASSSESEVATTTLISNLLGNWVSSERHNPMHLKRPFLSGEVIMGNKNQCGNTVMVISAAEVPLRTLTSFLQVGGASVPENSYKLHFFYSYLY